MPCDMPCCPGMAGCMGKGGGKYGIGGRKFWGAPGALGGALGGADQGKGA